VLSENIHGERVEGTVLRAKFLRVREVFRVFAHFRFSSPGPATIETGPPSRQRTEGGDDLYVSEST
jgi:hypothetical protein